MNNKNNKTVLDDGRCPNCNADLTDSYDSGFNWQDMAGSYTATCPSCGHEIFAYYTLTFTGLSDETTRKNYPAAKAQPEKPTQLFVVIDETPNCIPISLDDVEITAWNRDFDFTYHDKKYHGSYSYDGDDHQFNIDGVYSKEPFKDIPEDVQDAIEEYVRMYEGNQ